MLKLSDQIIDALDQNDVRTVSVYPQNGEYVAELEWYSPLGEDCIFTIWFDGSDDGFIQRFDEYSIGFDPEEHAELWISIRGKNGVPNSIRDLLEDADAIHEFLKSTSAFLMDLPKAA